MDFRLTEQQQALKAEFDNFFKEEMKAAPPEYKRGGGEKYFSSDAAWEFHRYLGKKLAKKGWLTRPWPKEYGGEDAPLIEQLIFNEVRAAYRAPGVDIYGVGMFAPTLFLAGNKEQKERLLPPIANAEVHYCQGWSEPNAGSDLAAVQTMAIKKGDHYLVNGQKIWTTVAQYADHMFLLARTDPNSERNAGLSVFNLSLDLPGVERRPIYYLNGAHVYNEVFFTDVKVPEYDRIGPENEGWKVTRETMNFERSGVDLFIEAKSGLEELIEYVKTTKRDGQLLSENPVIRQKIADMYIDLELGFAFAYRIAWMQEKGGLVMAASAASEAKLFGTELINRMADIGTEIQGMYGQVEDSKWSPMFGNMVDLYETRKSYTIAAGSSEIQRNLIAWVGLGLPRYK